MSIAEHLDQWRGERVEVFFRSNTPAWLVSLVFHLALLLILGLLEYVEKTTEDRLTVLVPADDLREELLDEMDLPVQLTLTDEPMPDIGATSIGAVEEAAAALMGEAIQLPTPVDMAETSTEVSDINVTLAEMVSNDRRALYEDLAGIRGGVVNAHGDRGSVDRITNEILSRLELSDVLVVWLMDASESLRPRREQLIQHFNRVYDELDVLAENRGDSLLTSVAAFGKELVMMTPEPTANREDVRQSVGKIKADDSGVENVFSAIKAVALKYADVARAGRKVMMIVVTDEAGDDAQVLDEAISLLKRNEMWVYVIGPIAPFARNEIKVKWTDEETGQTYFLPVDRGPETALIEHAKLVVWKDGPGSSVLASGFGPYGLTRITHENGGLYLLSDDGAIPGPSFKVETLGRYRPDYVSSTDYKKLASKSPLRTAILRISQASDELLDEPLPTVLLAAGIQFEILRVRKKLAEVVDALDRSLNELAAAEKPGVRETSPRWLAHYTLLKGRLLANRVRCNSYAQLLNEMYAKPKMPQDGTKNAWHLASLPTDTMPSEQKKDAEAAREYLQRVIDQFPDTPWSAIAKTELSFPLWFQWEEAFLEPPEGVPLPWDKKPWSALTEAERKAKVAFDKKKTERQKRKQESAAKAAEVKMRPPPKL